MIMLIYSEKLRKYILKNYIDKVLIDNKNYKIKGSFNRKIPYVTDIDIVNIVYPLVNENNIYQTIITFLNKISKNDKVIMVYVNFGYDERFNLLNLNSQTLKTIKSLLNEVEQREFEYIFNKYIDNIDKQKFFLTEFLKPMYKLKWTDQEILSNNKILRNDKTVAFTDFIDFDIYLVFKFFFIIKTHIIGSDIVVQYKRPTKNVYNIAYNYYVQFSSYNNEYFWMLYMFRQYFQHKDKNMYDKLYKFTEIECGCYKQMLTTIESYQILYKYRKLTIDMAKLLVTDLIIGCKKFDQFYKPNSILINRIIKASVNTDSFTRISLWYTLLDKLYDQINMFLNNISLNKFEFYLAKIPLKDRKNYYLN